MADAEAGVVWEAQGLFFTRELGLEEWRAVGQEIRRRTEGSAWALGDWLVSGGRQRGAGGGDVYDEAARITGYSKGHLSTAYSASVAYPRGQRFAGLTFTHHQIGLRMRDAAQRASVLRRAEQERWSSVTLADYVDKHVPSDDHDPFASGTGFGTGRRSTPLTLVRCPHCAKEFELRGNKVARPDGRKK